LWNTTAVSASPVESPDAPVIRVAGIAKRYGSTHVLESIDVEILPGVTGLLGPNGAGKTTLLGLLLGLQRPDAGRIEVLGLDPTKAGPLVRARVGYSPEHHLLPTDVPATDFVRHIAEVHGLPRRDATSRASDALWWVGLGEERFRPLGTMSTGQRQRVKLAMAIAHDPELIFLDEPTDGLDPTQRESMLDLIRRVGHEFGISVLLSSHLLDEVERTCDRVVIIDDGRVVVSGPIDEVRGTATGVALELDRPAGPLAEALVALGYDVVLDGNRLVVTPGETAGNQSALLRLVRDEVAVGRIGIRRLQPQVVTLEQVFLREGDRAGRVSR